MTAKEHVSKHDREIAAIRTLIKQGMRLVVEVQRAQKQTEASLKALIDSLERGGNGHSKRGIDLQ
jgi:hypothetical protein